MKRYLNRNDAGKYLVKDLKHYKDKKKYKDVIVLGLPRGGVPVAYEVARALDAPLDVFVVRKLGVPVQPELAMGAVASQNICYLNSDLLAELMISEDELSRVIQQERQELARREKVYRGNRSFLSLKGRTVIVVDDGIATGASIHAAIQAIATQEPAHLVVAIPVAPPEICKSIAALPSVDELVCPLQPAALQAVGLWYDDFSQTSDEEVRDLLSES